ncbi:NAD(P)-dependent alcohol dehydrogenase [Mycobacterium sp. E1747]|uniref:NAD(P)-dependent alcohol dehydrogenase n=1 Tax=Mycobacterium sp. E1747 TaxID=1834128 RepID=UPI0007FE1B6A|nr:NAD(P)-dependent alcohol dehydrogenase [Mycobacterium sp. E1747]OBH13577.1 hypothetical protein A5695_13635 [Mycobacterium sp. E1747]
MRTTAAVLRSPRSPLTHEELTIGQPRENEVVVRMSCAGICHTDLGVIASASAEQTPIVLGHEGAGVVEHVGSHVTTLAVGDHVVLSYNSCGACDNCLSQLPMHCRSFVELNFTGTRRDGSTPLTGNDGPVRGAFFGQSSWATRAVASERSCVRVDKDLPLQVLGPLGCGIQTGAGAVLNTLQPRPGSSIAIFGAGSVGLSALLAAVVAQCSPIIAVDISDASLARAKQLGATHTINSSHGGVAARIRALTGGVGACYTVDCIGYPDVVRTAVESLQAPGVCATLGYQGAPNDITLDQGQLLFGRSLVGVIEGDAVAAEFIPELLALYRAGRFPFDHLVQTFAFADINDAIGAVHRGEVSKAVVVFEPVRHSNCTHA